MIWLQKLLDMICMYLRPPPRGEVDQGTRDGGTSETSFSMASGFQLAVECRRCCARLHTPVGLFSRFTERARSREKFGGGRRQQIDDFSFERATASAVALGRRRLF